jgi:hypothetical protein
LLKRLSERDSEREVYISYEDFLRIMDATPRRYHGFWWVLYLTGFKRVPIHTWKSNARRSGIDEEVREKIMFHAGLKKNVTQRYGFIDDSELIRALDKFTYDNGDTRILAVSKSGK